MKTYTLTESELQELLRQQREICANTSLNYYTKNRFGDQCLDYGYVRNLIRNRPSPLLPTEEVGIKEDADHQIKISELREKFFKECCIEILADDSHIFQNAYHDNPDNVFEWFKPYLKIPSIDWEGMQNALIDDESINLSRSWTPHDDIIKWLKAKLQDYIK